MTKYFVASVLILLLAGIVLTGCTSNSGSREYIPGRGWVRTYQAP